jgi:hypothetical protein
LLALQDRKGLVDGPYLDAAVVDGQQAIAGLDGRLGRNPFDGPLSLAERR